MVSAANKAAAARADLLLAIGGGSVTDAAKMVAICLGDGIKAVRAELDALRVVTQPNGDTTRPSYKAPSIDSVIIPTTLSAGEFSAAAGCTDTRTMRKESYVHPDAIPGTVILDPAVTVHTPSGCGFPPVCARLTMRWKTLCAINSMPFSDGTSRHALYLLGKGLRQVKADPSDLAARLDCQLGAWMSIIGTSAGVRKGASHGIGHVLGGTAGVPHGYTSCVMLPHVLRFNYPVNAQRQAWVSDALGRPGEDAAEVVGDLIAELGLPRTLRAVGVKPDQLGPHRRVRDAGSSDP